MNLLLLLFLISGLCFSCSAQPPPDSSTVPPLFAFNNGLLLPNGEALPLAERVRLLDSLGYAGVEFNDPESLPEAREALAVQGLRVYTSYVRLDVEADGPGIDQSWLDVLPDLSGADHLLWLHVHSTTYKSSDPAADSLVLERLRSLTEVARPYGVRLALYPHNGFLVETVADAQRIVDQLPTQGVGVVFNLCHYLKNPHGELSTVLREILPDLAAVSISGADAGDTHDMGWDRLIRPLGEGSYDVKVVVEELLRLGYRGPFGLQCYGITEAPGVHLASSMRSWQAWKTELRE